MIDLYYWPTPNGHKITMFLEEMAMPYTIFPVNIGAGEQFKPEFLAIAPNNRMPAIVDHSPLERGAPISVFESGAILLYLAEKSEQFIPNESRGRVEVLQWLFWQVGGLGPMLGQNHHFSRYAPEKIPYAINRYVTEFARLLKVMDSQLSRGEYLAGDYSIADIASYGWVSAAFGLVKQANPDAVGEGKNVQRWIDTIGARPAVQKGMAVPKV